MKAEVSAETFYFIFNHERTTTFTVTAILKVTVTTFTGERYEWDSGLESVVARSLLMRIPAGIQCPGSLLKRYIKLSSKHVTRDPLDFLEEPKCSRIEKLHDCHKIRSYQNI